jgi:hypothetical protein
MNNELIESAEIYRLCRAVVDYHECKERHDEIRIDPSKHVRILGTHYILTDFSRFAYQSSLKYLFGEDQDELNEGAVQSTT